MSEGRASERTGGVDILDFLDLRILNQIEIKLITIKLELEKKNEKLNRGWRLDLKFRVGDLRVVVVVDRGIGIKR